MKFCLYYVFYCFMNFSCILLFYDFCCLRSSFGSISSWINDIQSKKRTNYWFTGQNEKFTLPFVLYAKWKFSLFGLTFGCKRPCDSVTGGPIFANLVSNIPHEFKEKSHEVARLKARRFCVHAKICLWGPPRPPPPVQLGLRESTYCQSTDTERHICGTVLTVQYLLSGDTKLMIMF